MELREKLIADVKLRLESFGYDTRRYVTADFDLIAIDKKRANALPALLMKILKNVDALTEKQAYVLHRLSKTLSYFACVVGLKTRCGDLEEGVVYFRFGIPSFTPNTLERVIRNEINVISLRGGLFANVDPERLRRARIKAGLSQAQLASLVGVSKKNIYEHEKSIKPARIEVVKRIETVLGERVTINRIAPRPCAIREMPRLSKGVKFVDRSLRRLGFSTLPLASKLLELLASYEVKIFTSTASKREIETKSEEMVKFADQTGERTLLVAELRSEERREIPILTFEEISKLSTAKELLDLLNS